MTPHTPTPREVALELMLCQLIHHATNLISEIENQRAIGYLPDRTFEMQTNLRCKLDEAETLIG